MQTIIPKHIIWEVLGNFLLGLSILTFVILMGRIFQLMDLIVNKGLGLLQILNMLWMMLPYLLVFSIPMSLALAIILTLGRASRDYEVVALKTSGVSIYQLIRPILLFSILMYFVTSYMIMYVAPRNNYNFKNFLVSVVSAQINIALDEKVFNNINGMIIYIDRIPVGSDHFYGIMIHDDANLEVELTIIAREGYIINNDDESNVIIRMLDANVLLDDKFSDSDKYLAVSSYDLNIDIFGDTDEEGNIKKKDRERTINEMFETVASIEKQLDYYENEYETPPDNDNPYAEKEWIVNDFNSQINRRYTDISERFALPFACIVFMLMGIPLGIQTNPRGKSGSLILGLIVLLIYYIFMAIGEFLGKNGIVQPLYSMWIGNIVLGIAGVYMLVKTGRESPVYIIVLYNDLMEFIRKMWARVSR
ncbi:MAG: LptF/LptG family permease [Deltaproteobacteria bacterium]|nr:LptF/LptG family permease [Candidatus Zymogenaceae bacterium]